MIARRALLAAGAALLCCPHHALAAPPAYLLTGARAQGGLLRGRTMPNAAVALDGKPVPISQSGRFAVGFGRDHGPAARLTLARRGEPEIEVPLAVAPRTYRVQRIDGLPDAQVTPPDAVLARIKSDQERVRAARAHDTAQDWFAEAVDWPVTGPITGVYGSQRILNGEPRQPHFGVDVAAPEGAPVRAPLPGIVRMADPDLYFTGGTVILDHGRGVSTTYLHLSRLDVGVGERLARGDVLGAVGATGRATGPHLCWRLNWFQERLDPQLVAGPMPA